MEEQDNFHFLLLVAFSLVSSILKYSSTSSTVISSFFLVSLGVLFWAGALQGFKGPSSSGFGLRMVVLDLFHLEGLLCMAHNLRS